MPKHCAAFGCTNNSSKENCKKNQISFHGFPINSQKLLKEWVVKLKREDYTPSKYSVLCSEHFTEDDFIYENFTGRRLLKSDAIPSVFVFKEAAKRKRTSYEFGANVAEPAVSPRMQDFSCNEVAVQTETNSFDVILNINKEQLNVISDLREKLKKKDWSPDNEYIEKKMNTLTGFDKVRFDVIHDFLKIPDGTTITGKMKLFIFLMRLRTGITEEMMGILFSMSQSTISRIFSEMTIVIYNKIKNIKIWPSKMQIKATMPPFFRQNYPECRVIIDCTEIIIQKPSDPKEQQITFSYYKNANTLKCLIGITPSASISFISDAWTGSISDKVLFLKSGILDLLEKNDLIIADRGFTIRDEVEKAGIKLVTPHFLKDKIQFTFEERKENKKVSHHRIHVERAIGRIKLFKLLDGPVPYTLLPSLNQLIYISAFLVNFGTHIL